MHFWTQDLSFLAHRVGREVLFQVLVAGTQGQNPHLAWRLPVLVHPDQVVAVTRALLDLFRAQGSREKRHQARLRYLVERIGIDAVQAWVEERVPLRPWPDLPAPSPAARNDDLVGWFPQAQPDRWTMGLCVPLGRLSWRQLEALAVLAKRWGDGRAWPASSSSATCSSRPSPRRACREPCKPMLYQRDGHLTRDLLRAPGGFGLGQVPAKLPGVAVAGRDLPDPQAALGGPAVRHHRHRRLRHAGRARRHPVAVSGRRCNQRRRPARPGGAGSVRRRNGAPPFSRTAATTTRTAAPASSTRTRARCRSRPTTASRCCS